MARTMQKKRSGGASTDPTRVGKVGMRDKSTINRLNMYRGGKPVRNKKGQITGGDFMAQGKSGNKDVDATTGRVQADRRWFGNTRVVSATQLDRFREVMASKAADPYSVVLHSKALPLGLLVDNKAQRRAHLLSAVSFQDTFGKRAVRKRPRLAAGDLAELASASAASGDAFAGGAEGGGGGLPAREADGPDFSSRAGARDAVLSKGTSRRIWSELYRVMDCSDVVVQVLDARDPQGTRSLAIEKHLRENAKHKNLVFVLNKVDLVPTWVTRRWVAALSEVAPTLAFTAGNMTKAFGKGSLIALLRQLSRLHADKKAISVGFIGYPNVGKSSVINALKGSKACNVAPIPGETKVWQYVTLTKRVFLIDCPGTVHLESSLRGTGSAMAASSAGRGAVSSSGGGGERAALDADEELVLKGVVRAEKLDAPEIFIPAILARVRPEHVRATYGISAWSDAGDFLARVAAKQGRMLKGGEPDIETVAINVVNDWQRGKLPYFTPPPDSGGAAAGGGGGGGGGGGRAAKRAAAADLPALVPEGAGAPQLAAPKQVLKGLARHELLAAEESEGEGGGEEEEEEEEEEEDEEEEEGGGGARTRCRR